MRKILSVLFVLLLGVMVVQPAVAAAPAGQLPGVMVADAVKITATVEAIDYAKRTVTLKGPEGNTVTLKVGEAARNFDQVKVGDQVVAQYFDSVALYVKKPGGQPSAGEATMVKMAPRGAKPEGVVVNTTELTATVEAIDYAKRTVTLKGPEGNTVTLKVDKSAKDFKNVKKGDQVVARFTEAVAISVQKPW